MAYRHTRYVRCVRTRCQEHTVYVTVTVISAGKSAAEDGINKRESRQLRSHASLSKIPDYATDSAKELMFSLYWLDCLFGCLLTRLESTQKVVDEWSWIFQRCDTTSTYSKLRTWRCRRLGPTRLNVCRTGACLDLHCRGTEGATKKPDGHNRVSTTRAFLVALKLIHFFFYTYFGKGACQPLDTSLLRVRSCRAYIDIDILYILCFYRGTVMESWSRKHLSGLQWLSLNEVNCAEKLTAIHRTVPDLPNVLSSHLTVCTWSHQSDTWCRCIRRPYINWAELAAG